MQSILEFFYDPVLVAPTIGSMLICMIAALIGTFAVLKRYALVGEMLSHASYPGVIVCMILFSTSLLWMPLVGAAISCVLAMCLVESMQSRFKIKADAALTFVLASFFGIGLTFLTAVQNSLPTLYKRLQSYLFGQAATMTNEYIWAFLAIFVFVLIVIYFFYRHLMVSIFDPEFAEVSGMKTKHAKWILLGLIVIATVVGIRSVGVVLMSSMLIFPVICARFWTKRLVPLLFLACLFGLVFGFLGIYLSHVLSLVYDTSFATGPTIVLVASFVFFLCTLFASQRGLFIRLMRRFLFWYRCQQENLLKAMWKYANTEPSRQSLEEIEVIFSENKVLVQLLLWRLQRAGKVNRVDKNLFELTPSGIKSAKKIVRLHRLWELYLVRYCGVSRDRVHPSAEEMEHSITPEIEQELEELLGHPRQDPHHRPIPKKEEVL